MLKRFVARILQYEGQKQHLDPYKEDNMATPRKLTLINGTINEKGGIQTYRATNSFKMACEPGWIAVPPLPFPDDDWDDFDQSE